MKVGSFQDEIHQYGATDWHEQKEIVKSWIDKTVFLPREKIQWFDSDRYTSKQFYKDDFVKTFQQNIDMFCNDIGKPLQVEEVWIVRYQKGDFHPPHAHGAKGYSGILMAEFDENEHTGPWFVQDNPDPITDRTNYCAPKVFEGDIIFSPSRLLHFTYPNTSDKERIIVGFDMKSI